MYGTIEGSVDDGVAQRPWPFTTLRVLVACTTACFCAFLVVTFVNTLEPVLKGNLGSCAFVANNPTLPMGGGPKIDAHDTVVRFNNFWERRISDKRKGTKVDLLVIIAKFKEFKKNYGGKCILRTSRRDRWNSKEIREAGCETIPRRVYHACMRSLKDQYNATQNFPPVVPSTGMLGVMHIGHRCASIALYGFTLPEPPYPTFPQVPHLFAEEHAVLKSVFPKAVFH